METGLFFNGKPQGLTEVLQARDARVAEQALLLKKFEKPLISYKLNMPGPVKYSPEIHKIFDAGLEDFRGAMASAGQDILFEKLIYEDCGPEYFAVFDGSPQTVKHIAILVEDNHPLGRLFDFDVLNQKGWQLSRQAFDLKQRRCLICEEAAVVCSRERNHGLEALLAKIQDLYQAYFFKDCNID